MTSLNASAAHTPDFLCVPYYPCFLIHCSIQPSFGNGEPILPRPLPSRISDKENNGATDLDSDEEPQKVPFIKSTLQFSYFDLSKLITC
jgi:hypothetical protein